MRSAEIKWSKPCKHCNSSTVTGGSDASMWIAYVEWIIHFVFGGVQRSLGVKRSEHFKHDILRKITPMDPILGLRTVQSM